MANGNRRFEIVHVLLRLNLLTMATESSVKVVLTFKKIAISFEFKGFEGFWKFASRLEFEMIQVELTNEIEYRHPVRRLSGHGELCK